MKVKIRISVSAVLLCLATSAFAQQYVGILSQVFNYAAASQQLNEWCWAASVQMILNYYGIPVTQQEVVGRIYGLPINAPGSDAAITVALNAMGRQVNGQMRVIRATEGPGLPPPPVLLNELNAQHPILLAFASGPNSGHAVVITAASFLPGTPGPQIASLVIRDPWPSPLTVQTGGRVEIGGAQLSAFAQSVRSYWLVSVN